MDAANQLATDLQNGISAHLKYERMVANISKKEETSNSIYDSESIETIQEIMAAIQFDTIWSNPEGQKQLAAILQKFYKENKSALDEIPYKYPTVIKQWTSSPVQTVRDN